MRGISLSLFQPMSVLCKQFPFANIAYLVYSGHQLAMGAPVFDPILERQMNHPSEKPVTLTNADLEGVVGGTTSGPVGVNLGNLQGMDLEAVMLLVQSERAKISDAQVQTYAQEAQNRNEQVDQLNEALGAANAIKATFGADAPANAVFGAGLNATQRDSLISTFTKEYGDTGTTFATDALKDGQLTKGEVDTLVTQTKGMIDAIGNSQQMDMLRQQSMSSNRNDAYELMANFVKKMQETRASVIPNLR